MNATARSPVTVYLFKRKNPLYTPGLSHTYEMVPAEGKGHSVHLKLREAIAYARKQGWVPTAMAAEEGFTDDMLDLTPDEWKRVKKAFKL